jgi:hypothetical protein
MWLGISPPSEPVPIYQEGLGGIYVANTNSKCLFTHLLFTHIY